MFSPASRPNYPKRENSEKVRAVPLQTQLLGVNKKVGEKVPRVPTVWDWSNALREEEEG